MAERTTTVWTCTRCGSQEEVEGLGQPKDWCRVGFVNPPKASWSDRLTVLGDLCNASTCGGLLVAFMHGDDDKERARLVEFELAMIAIQAEEETLDERPKTCGHGSPLVDGFMFCCDYQP